MQDFVGTPERLGALRGFCLTRDRHRCVITRAFDQEELEKRLRQPPPAKDDDGNILDPLHEYNYLEVAHILPFSLTKVEGEGELVCGLFFFSMIYDLKQRQASSSLSFALATTWKRTSLRRPSLPFLICLTLA
jgi:hypothetical protein